MEAALEVSWKKKKKQLTEREKKVIGLSDITENFKKSGAAFIVDFKGLDVEAVTKLRKTLRKVDSDIMVVKNTIAKRALSEGEKTALPVVDLFTGTNAIVYAYGDVGTTAKTIDEFKKENDKLKIKAGYMDGRKLEAHQVEALAKLPSKDVLRAQLLGTLAAPMSKFVRQLAAAPSGFVRVLNAYKEKQEKGS